MNAFKQNKATGRKGTGRRGWEENTRLNRDSLRYLVIDSVFSRFFGKVKERERRDERLGRKRSR